MRQIVKGSEPESLTQHRRTIARDDEDDDPEWDDYRDKKDAFAALCHEQGYLCAYCMARIKPGQEPGTPNRRKIEHWISQCHSPGSPHEPAVHREHRFKWSNLLGVCPGGVTGSGRSPRSGQHCDSYRGNTPLHVHPALSPAPVETYFEYGNDGTISSTHPNVALDIKTLNLDCSKLKERRARVLADLRKTLGSSRTWTVAALSKELARWRATRPVRYQDTRYDADKGADVTETCQGVGLREYCQVAVYFLERQIRKRSKSPRALLGSCPPRRITD